MKTKKTQTTRLIVTQSTRLISYKYMYCTYKRNVNQLGSLNMLFVYARKQILVLTAFSCDYVAWGVLYIYAIKNTYSNDSSLMPAFFAFCTLVSKSSISKTLSLSVSFIAEKYTVCVIGMYCIENDSSLRGLCTYSTLYYRECLMHICTLHRFTLSGKCMPFMSPINSFLYILEKVRKLNKCL
jgi:hypothetical protein